MPLSKIRLKFDPYVEQPVVRFRWRASQDFHDWAAIFDPNSGYISYMVINCKESDFPFNIPVE